MEDKWLVGQNENLKKKKHVFKDGVDTPCLATSRTNNRARVSRWHDESSNNNDNKVI